MPENAGAKQDGRFRKGVSGNPSGKPRGCRNKATRAAEMLLAGEAEALTRVLIERAKAGDPTALRLATERICPPIRERTVRVEIPPVADAADLLKAMGRLFEAVVSGEISPSEGQSIAALLEPLGRAFEAVERARLDEVGADNDPQVIRVSIVGNPEHTRQIAKEAEEAARRRGADDREREMASVAEAEQ
jgi:hypothetical protein